MFEEILSDIQIVVVSELVFVGVQLQVIYVTLSVLSSIGAFLVTIGSFDLFGREVFDALRTREWHHGVLEELVFLCCFNVFFRIGTIIRFHSVVKE